MLKLCSNVSAVFDEETIKCFNSLYDYAIKTANGKTNKSLILRSIVKYADKHKADISFDIKKYKGDQIT